MDKNEVIAFFDRCAPSWDAEQVDHSAAIEEILDNAGVARGQSVMDVACGTGILFPFYLERGVDRVTGIDISPEMVRLAREKFAGEERIQVLCGDVEEAAFEEKFDRVVLHNAFPHFPDPDRLIGQLASFLRPGGVLTIAHSMSREQINEHHKGSAAHVSCGLMPAGELAARMGKHLTVTTVISDDMMYQVVGVKE